MTKVVSIVCKGRDLAGELERALQWEQDKRRAKYLFGVEPVHPDKLPSEYALAIVHARDAADCDEPPEEIS